ncbi:MAG: hypothetical protein ACI841_003469 [Planctomycetota bacterium]|jgi:hypothetical protein
MLEQPFLDHQSQQGLTTGTETGYTWFLCEFSPLKHGPCGTGCAQIPSWWGPG